MWRSPRARPWHLIKSLAWVPTGAIPIPSLEAICFAEFGETGILYVAAPVIPDPVTGQRRAAYAVQGPWVVWAKAAFERYFMLKMRAGAAMPWFERLGLRLLFGVDLVRPQAATPVNTVASA